MKNPKEPQFNIGQNDCVMILKENGDHEIHIPDYEGDEPPAQVELMTLLALAMQDEEIMHELYHRWEELNEAEAAEEKIEKPVLKKDYLN